MKAPYLTINTGAELFCAIVGCYCFLRQKDARLQLLWLFVLLVFCVETYGLQIRSPKTPNSWLYNLLLPIQLLFFSSIIYHLYSKYFKDKRLVLAIVMTTVIIVMAAYAYDYYLHGFHQRHKIAQTAFSVQMTCYCLYFFYLLLEKETYVELSTSPEFWFVAGSLFYFFGTSVINIYSDPLNQHRTRSFDGITYAYRTLNVILYGCWSYSFICKRWQLSK